MLTVPTTALAGGVALRPLGRRRRGGARSSPSRSARQWGPEGIAVNVLAVAPDRVLADAAVAGPVSIAAPAVPDADAGPVLAFLCSPAAGDLAGQTLTVDGGLWM